MFDEFIVVNHTIEFFFADKMIVNIVDFTISHRSGGVSDDFLNTVVILKVKTSSGLS
jgi:hypothetical protein